MKYTDAYVMDMVFEYVSGAIRELQEGDSDKALRFLSDIYPYLARLTLKTTEASVGSKFWNEMVKVAKDE